MKFSLQEKFILDEKYILAEANEWQNAGKTNIDWAHEFIEAIKDDTVDGTWVEYWEKEWGDKADFVRSLGQGFPISLQEYGYTEKLNPFITFIKYAIDKNLKLTKDTYTVIHNACSENEDIVKEMLVTPKSNILGNSEVYTKPLAEFEDYIKLYIKVKDKTSLDDREINEIFFSVDGKLKSITSIKEFFKDNNIYTEEKELADKSKFNLVLDNITSVDEAILTMWSALNLVLNDNNKIERSIENTIDNFNKYAIKKGAVSIDSIEDVPTNWVIEQQRQLGSWRWTEDAVEALGDTIIKSKTNLFNIPTEQKDTKKNSGVTK